MHLVYERHNVVGAILEQRGIGTRSDAGALVVDEGDLAKIIADLLSDSAVQGLDGVSSASRASTDLYAAVFGSRVIDQAVQAHLAALLWRQVEDVTMGRAASLLREHHGLALCPVRVQRADVVVEARCASRSAEVLDALLIAPSARRVVVESQAYGRVLAAARLICPEVPDRIGGSIEVDDDPGAVDAQIVGQHGLLE